MSLPDNPIVVIPSRLASSRLPDKPLALIRGEAMIVHVWRRALEAETGPVLVACAEREIADTVTRAGGRAVLTRSDHASGSDRIHEALQTVDPERQHDAVINVQGDLPDITAASIRAAFTTLEDPAVDIATLAVEIVRREDRRNPNVVKAAVAFERLASGTAPPDGRQRARACYFSRAPVPWSGPDDDFPLYHHIGLYAYRRAALERFVSLPHSPLEQREKLEQLRALEAGMRIDVALVDRVPLEINTPADLERARLEMGRGL